MTYRDQLPDAYENQALIDAIDRHEQAGLGYPEGTEQRQAHLDRSDAAFEQLMDRMWSGPCPT